MQIDVKREPFYPNGDRWARAGETPRLVFNTRELRLALDELEDFLGYPRRRTIQIIDSPKDLPDIAILQPPHRHGHEILMWTTSAFLRSAPDYGRGFRTTAQSPREKPMLITLTNAHFPNDHPAFPKLRALQDKVMSHGGWVWPAKGKTLVLRSPVAVHYDANDSLHCEDGPAVKWKGENWYFWHGVKISRDILKRQFTANQIDKQANLEVRRVMIEIYGIGAYMKETGAKMVQEDRYGKLWRRHGLPQGWWNESRDIVVVEVVNSTPEPDGTYNHYFLRVPPQVKTAHEAVAWTFGKTPGEYHPLKET